MSLKRELTDILDNSKEPIEKRLKVADEAFKSSKHPLRHKKAVLIHWLLKNVNGEMEYLNVLKEWLNCNQFQNLTRNDISSEEIENIIISFIENAHSFENFNETVMECVIKIIQHKVFQQHFKFDTNLYCKFIAIILETFSDVNILTLFLKRNIFSKEICNEEKFLKSFLEHVMQSFVKCIIKFNNEDLLNQISFVIQKTVLANSQRSFEMYLNRYFNDDKTEKQLKPKYLIKHLLNVYKENIEIASCHFKLIFHAFVASYKDFKLVFKFFAILIHILGFDLNQKIIFHKALTLDIPELSLCKSQFVIYELLEVLTKIEVDLKCTIQEISFSEFLSNILVEFLRFKLPSGLLYKIFVKVMILDPIILESLVEEIFILAMMADNTADKFEYEQLIISIFEIYSKLHRIESLVSKMVQALSEGFNDKSVKINELYVFRGEIDIHVKHMELFQIDDILTEEILRHFTKCICGLASWQVINIFKTLLHHLNEVLNEIDSRENENTKYCTFFGILSKLISTFLLSIRVVEHTVTASVVEKCKKCLDDLQKSLQKFGSALVKREHSHVLMWSFLNIAYHWAEISIVLKYYNMSNDNNHESNTDSTSADITYLHSYLNVKEWHLLSERITNFGEKPCKQLLYKLYIQKLKALQLFEYKLNKDVIVNVLRILNVHLDEHWQDIFEDRFVVNCLIQEMDLQVFENLVEILISNLNKSSNFIVPKCILNSTYILNAVNFQILTKINKLFVKQQKKLMCESLSVEMFSYFDQNTFLMNNSLAELTVKIKNINEKSVKTNEKIIWKINEEKMNSYLENLKKFPLSYVDATLQEMYFSYLFALHRDLSETFSNGCLKIIQENLEVIIIGILQLCKFKLHEIFLVKEFCLHILNKFNLWEETFTLVTDNVLACISDLEPFVNYISKNLLSSNHMQCSIILMNSLNKTKKSKMSKELKFLAENYKNIICTNIVELITSEQPQDDLLKGFVYALRHFFPQNNDSKSKLLNKLDIYIEYALNCSENISNNHLLLFITILQNKTQISSFNEELIVKIWKAFQQRLSAISEYEEYSQFIVLLISHVPNEQYSIILEDLLSYMVKCIREKEIVLFRKHLKTWEGVLSCNVNPVKVKYLQESLSNLWQNILLFLEEMEYDRALCTDIVEFHKATSQTVYLNLTSSLIDLLLLAECILLEKQEFDFYHIVSSCIAMLSSLLKFRKVLILDRLPPYLQGYRCILKAICKRANANLKLDEANLQQLGDCAHHLERLTKMLIAFPKDMGRIAMYLIADILEQYEQVTIYPTVKVHLNNCIYSLISVCDQHATSYLLRVLSSASTEMFKIEYENYKKYYRFTGKI